MTRREGHRSLVVVLGCERETTIPTVAGALQLGEDGTISMNGDAWFRGVLNNEKDTIVFTDGNCHDAQLGMLVRSSANYVQEDLQGVRKGHNVGGQDWWDVFALEIETTKEGAGWLWVRKHSRCLNFDPWVRMMWGCRLVSKPTL